MAIAGKWLAAHFNRPGFEMFDFDVYALVRRRLPDGRHLQRGRVAGRPPASSSNLCWIYDNNHITIEGHTDLAFSEDVATRFIALRLERHARRRRQRPRRCSSAPSTTFKETTDRPTLIIVDSHIGYGAPNKQDTHARPRRAARRGGDPADQAQLRLAGGREVPRARRRARALRATASARAARELRDAWMALFDEYKAKHPGAGRRSSTGCSAASCPTAGTRTCRRSRPTPKGMAGRDASGKVLNALAKNVPWLIGGSADLAPVDQDAARRSRAPATSRPTTTAAATSTSASASTRWARSSTAWRCRRCGPTARAS